MVSVGSPESPLFSQRLKRGCCPCNIFPDVVLDEAHHCCVISELVMGKPCEKQWAGHTALWFSSA